MMNDNKLYRYLNWSAILAIAICVVIVICVSQCKMAKQSPVENTVEQARKKLQDLQTRRLEEQNLRTRDDSIHFYEDGF